MEHHNSSSEITIDLDLCTGCGLCVPVCPHEIFLVVEGKASIDKNDCFKCGHCMAACPVEAVSVSGVNQTLDLETIDEVRGVYKNDRFPTSDLVHLMRSRRSCRNYTGKDVPVEILRDLVKVGTTAPSGTNSQGWKFTLVPTRHDVVEVGELTADFYRRLNRLSKNPLARLYSKLFLGDSLGKYYSNYYHSIDKALKRWDENQEDLLFHGATSAILISSTNDASCGAEDALLATQNILLAAHNIGLGSCLIGFVVEAVKRDRKMHANLKLSAGETLRSVIALGYPMETYSRPAGRKKVAPRILTFNN